MLWRAFHVLGLCGLAVLVVAAVIFVGPVLDAGASGSWVDVSGSGTGPYVCGWDADGSCDPGGGTGTMTAIVGPATITLTTADDTSGDDVELTIANFGVMTGGTCDTANTLVTPTYAATTGSSDPDSCTLDAGESALLVLEDEGPYNAGGDTDVGVSAYTPTISPDDPADFVSGGGGGGGGSSGTSAFSSLSGMVSWVDSALTSLGPGVVAVGAGLMGLAIVVMAVWYLFRLFRRMAS